MGFDPLRGGYQQVFKQSKRGIRFFAIKIEEYFEFSVDWYHRTEVGDLVLQYYHLLRSVIQDQPYLRKCLTRCRHCRIFFLTDPRNAARRDLGCAFGCQKAHEKQSSAQRSLAYYRTETGKQRKAVLNKRRHLVCGPIAAEEKDSLAKSEPEADPAPPPESEPELGLSEEIIEHVRVVVSLIEKRRVSREEVLEMLAKILRQHRMDRWRKIDQALWRLNEKPP